jgi:hypothetical protein
MDIKIPFYNIVNMFLIGLVFTGFCIILFFKDIHQFISTVDIDGLGFQTLITISIFAVIYEVGLIINRIGSVLIESIFIKSKLIPFNTDYKKFNETKEQYPIMGTLSREYASSRSSFTMFFILIFISFIQQNWLLFIFSAIAAFLFFFSVRKHATKIVSLMDN